MKMKLIFATAFLVLSPFSIAHAGLLQKSSDAELKQISLPGYSIMEEQAFKIASGPLAGKLILFASFDPEKSTTKKPGFFVLENGKVLDSKPLPTLEDGWNIVDVTAVSATPGQGKSALRILAVMTLEPISNRTEDYWDQAFVLDVGSDGKIDDDRELNEKISKKKPAVKTIEALKAFLSKP